MRKLSVLFFFCFLSASTLFSQSNKMYMLSGKVVEKSGAAIPYALVAVYNASDSTLISGGTSTEDGSFEIKIKEGNYYVRVTFLSFREKFIPGINVKGADVAMGTITLIADAELLNAVEIVSEKKQMELHLDKRVFNVAKDMRSAGSNASEILDNIPSVNVDVEGNVSLRGSQNVRILIDGKPSGLVGISKADALRMLQGSMIESVEIITNPSARYDAEGEVGIINIILKKEKRAGFNGSFDVSAGYPDNYSASYSINYRKNKINLFSSYGVNYRNGPGSGHFLQKFSGDTVYSFETIRKHTRGDLGNNFRLGADYFINDYNTLTFAGMYKYSVGLNDAELIYNDFDNTDVLTQTVTRTEDEKEIQQNIELELNHRKTYKQKGRVWTTNFKWIDSDDAENAKLLEVSDFIGSANINQRSANIENEANWFFQSDYTHPISKDGKVEAGLKATSRFVNNIYTVEQQQLSDNTWFVLPGFDNDMVYSEKIYAAYLMAGNKKNKFGYQGGLRAEYSDIYTELRKTNEINPRSYLNLFPSTHFSYELDSVNTLQLSYSRRLSRPRFRELLPFYGLSDNRSYFSGNPDLNPEYTNSIELGHLRYLKKGSVLSSIYYRHRTGVVERITTIDTAGLIRIFPVNLSIQDAFGIELSANYEIVKWWKLNGSFNFYRAQTKGTYDAQNFNFETYTWTAKATSKITLYKKTDFQTSFDYRAPQITAQGKALAIYAIDLGLSADVLKGKGTLVFSVRDLLNTRRRRSVINTPGFYSETDFQWRARQFLITFNYRVNQNKKAQRAERLDEDMGM